MDDERVPLFETPLEASIRQGAKVTEDYESLVQQRDDAYRDDADRQDRYLARYP